MNKKQLLQFLDEAISDDSLYFSVTVQHRSLMLATDAMKQAQAAVDKLAEEGALGSASATTDYDHTTGIITTQLGTRQ